MTDTQTVSYIEIEKLHDSISFLETSNKELAKKVADLQFANEELESFTYTVSHDLQEPLRTISGFLQLLERTQQPALNEEGLQYIHFAIDGANRMKTLIQDLLSFSKLDKVEHLLEPVDFNMVAEDVKRLLAKSIQEKNAVVHVAILPTVMAEKTTIIQLLQNLVSNGLKYQHPGNNPLIEISCKKREKDWLFSIRDNGIGIPAVQQEKIFEVFHRVNTKQEYSGSGIGLSICKKIIDRLQGSIWVESDSESGSEFNFTLAHTI